MKKIFLFALLTFTLNVFAQVSKTVTIASGNLSITLTAEEKSTVTNLTIKGSADARDFKTMRDNMPLLAVLDLSSLTISAYIGIEGTSPFGNNIYPANTIPEAAFMLSDWKGKNSLTTILLPESITSIAQNAFYSCNGLSTISFPASCTSIGDDTFSMCLGLTNVPIPSTIFHIGDRAFMGSSGLINVDAGNPNYSSLDGVLFDKGKTTLLQCPVSKTGTYSIPGSVVTIGTRSFYKCIGLTSVNIPSSVTSIADFAFLNCTNLDGTLILPSSLSFIGSDVFSHCLNLDEVNIPASVASIGSYAFYDCGGNFNVDASNPYYSSHDGILFNKTKTILIQCGSSRQESYNIPTSVTTIGQSAFSRCRFLTGVTIPSSVTTIGTNAFWGCTNMFGSIVIPSGVTSIGSYAFSGCTGLSSIYSYPKVPVDLSSSSQVFYNVNKSGCKLYVPKGSKVDYQWSYQWQDFENIIEMPGFELSATSIAVGAAQGSKVIVDITSDVAWTGSSDKSWLSISPASGDGNGKITLTAAENPGNTIRTARVTISATGLEPQTIDVAQSYVLQSLITKLYDFDLQLPYSFAYGSRFLYDGEYIYAIMQDISFDPVNSLARIKPDGSNFEVLYSFDFNGYADIQISLSENTIYGIADDYGNQEVMFKIGTDGKNYSRFDFIDDLNIDLSSTALIVSNNVIYGSAIDNNTYASTLFKVNADGSGYSVIYSSTQNSFDNLILSGNTIIGNNYGKIAKVNTDGSGFFDFDIYSDVPVIADNTMLYGMVNANEVSDGYLFKVNKNGSGFTKIKTLNYAEFGSYFIGTLYISGNTLYGMTGDKNEIFKVNTDGTGFAKIQHDIQLDIYSTSELTLVGDELFGFTSEAGMANTMFKINTTDDTFSEVLQFGTSPTGAFPMSTMIESGDYLYGNTFSGGSFNMGTLFKIKKDGSGYTKIFDFKGTETGIAPTGQLTLVENKLYGTASDGFNGSGYGCIFKINTDGTGFEKLHEFDGINGSGPNGSLVMHKGSLYGMTGDGGTESHGVIFKINTDGTGFEKISDNTDFDTGENPYNGITISDDDVIYGVTTVDYGGVFKVNTDGTGLMKLFEMNNESGDFSYCKPLLVADELFITTSEGGANGVGTIFKIKTDGTGFTVLYNFEGIDDSQGFGFRNNSLVFHNGVLYGTATGNGINNDGYLYKINVDGSGFARLSDFYGDSGAMPYLCDLIIDQNNDIYAMTTLGGVYDGGIIYKYSLNETSITGFDIGETIQVKVFPNPTKGNIQLRFNKVPKPKTWITVYDVYGKIILKTLAVNKEEFLNLNGKASGLYIVKVDLNTPETFKIVLE